MKKAKSIYSDSLLTLMDVVHLKSGNVDFVPRNILKSGIIHNVSSLTFHFFAHWFIASATAATTASRSDVLGLLCLTLAPYK